MKAPAPRRAALGAILAAPLASVPAAAKTIVPGISPELARLIRKSQRADDRLKAEAQDVFSPGNIRAAAALRCRVARFKAASLADVLAKARHTVAIWDRECCQEEFDGATEGGCAYLDDMAHALLLDVARLAEEGTLCA